MARLRTERCERGAVTTEQPIRERRPSQATFSLPLDTVGVSEVMPLRPLLKVKQNDDGGNEVDNLSGWKEINVGSAVFASVPVTARVKETTGHTWTHLETPANLAAHLFPLLQRQASTLSHSSRSF